MKLKKTEQAVLLIALLILCLTCIPRFYDTLKFLPDYSIDENDVVESAVGFLGGDLDPHWYRYGPLCAYLLTAIYSLQAIFTSGTLDDYAINILFNPTKLYYTARLVHSLFGVLLTGLVYLIARVVFRKKVVVLALALAAFPFFDLLVDFRVRVDTMLAIWSSLCLYFCLKVVKTGRLKDYVFAGVCLGLSLATKPLPALLILPTIFLANVFGAPSKDHVNTETAVPRGWSQVNTTRCFKTLFHSKLHVCLLMGIIFNFLFHPYSLLNFNDYLGQQLQIILHDGQRTFAPGWDLIRFFDTIGAWFTLMGTVAVAYGLYKALVEKNAMLLTLVSYPIVFWLAFAPGAARNYFYVPLLPAVIILIATLIEDLGARLPTSRLKHALQVALLGLILVPPALSLITTSWKMNRSEDYRDIHTALSGKQWIEATIPASSKIVLYGYYVSLPRIVDHDLNRQALLGEYFMYYRIQNEYLKKLFIKAFGVYKENGGKTYQITNFRNHLGDKERYLFSYCRHHRIEYVVSHHDISHYPGFKDKLLKVFEKPRYPFGSSIWIYQMGPAPAV